MRKLTLSLLFIAIMSTVSAIAQEVEFNYNGRVKVQGQAYSGPGYFKFALVNKSGDITFWANDGVTLDGTEPLSAVDAEVKEGFFSVNIGDTDTTNMAALDASLFNSKQKINLRTWFSDGSHGFEQLKPDREVVNPALLGGKSFKQIDIYIDPQNGDDSFAGLKPAKPKKTIQSAWNSLPTLLETTATLHLANGVYREQVLLKGKMILGDATILILGNTNSPDSVRVTGADASNENLQVRQYGFDLENQKGLVIKGIYFDHTYAGIYLNQYSTAIIRSCKFRQNGVGAYANNYSYMECYQLDIDSTLYKPDGIKLTGTATAVINYCTISSVYCGIHCFINSNCSLTGNTISNCSLGGLVVSMVSFSSIGWDGSEAAKNKFLNNSRGIYVDSNSSILYAKSGGCSFSGNGQDYSSASNGVYVD
jgi:parallel beta-helix repeat protein